MREAKARVVARFLVGLVAVLAAGAGPAMAQAVVPSLYLGLGTGTNIGGTVGVGVEVRVARQLAASVALGVWPEALREEALGGDAFDFDVGVKAYPTGRWLFAGINYGIIHAEVSTPRAERFPVLRKRRGFTFSLGLRTPPLRGLYASGFVGVTSDAEANHLTVFDRRTFMPHFGLMVGVELPPVR